MIFKILEYILLEFSCAALFYIPMMFVAYLMSGSEGNKMVDFIEMFQLLIPLIPALFVSICSILKKEKGKMRSLCILSISIISFIYVILLIYFKEVLISLVETLMSFKSMLLNLPSIFF